MGLDSYLFRRGKTTGGKMLMGLKDDAEHGQEELGYWRKDYDVHTLFADYRADGEDDNVTEIPLTEEDLKEILQKLTEIETINYDYTLEVIKEALKTDFENEEVYYYAWY